MKILAIYSKDDCELKTVGSIAEAVEEIKSDLETKEFNIPEVLSECSEDFQIDLASGEPYIITDILGNTVNYKIFNLTFENPPTKEEILALC